MNKKPLIVFGDDEARLIDSYKMELELELNCEVKIISNTDKLLEFLQTGNKQVDLLILDVMMPPGSNHTISDRNHQEGLNTGLIIYEILREKGISLPIVIFTNSVRDEQNQIVTKISQDDKAKFLQKEDYLPFELADEIKSFIEFEQ
ncbi:MAG: response regulator [Cyanobacteria bacterium J06621_8]